MKRFLGRLICLAGAVAIIFIVSENKAEISHFVDELVHQGIYVDREDVSSEESHLGSEYKNHFASLSDNQKKAYNNILCEIYNADESYPELIEIPLMTNDEMSAVFEAVNYDNPDIMCFGHNNKIIFDSERCFFQPSYTLSPKEQKDREATLYKKCNDILALVPHGADEFEKELFIHDYIINNCVYDDSFVQQTSDAYSCLVDGVSSCEGYSKATKLLLEKAGIECYTVTGDGINSQGETRGHMWNIVKIQEAYYHLDVTWDDPSTPDGEPALSHLYMNVTDEEISLDHLNFSSPFNCTSMKSNYYVKTDCYFDKFNQKEKDRLVRLIGTAQNNQLEMKFADSKVYDNAVNYLIDRKNIYYFIKKANADYSSSYSTYSLEYIENRENCLLEIYFN